MLFTSLSCEAADPWWINCLGDVRAGLLVLRGGAVFAHGGLPELLAQDLPELSTVTLAQPPPVAAGNPQDEALKCSKIY